jgi:hypothetical protein
MCCPLAHSSSLILFTHSNRLRFWGSESLVVVESKCCHDVMFEADSQLKLLPPSIFDIHKVFEHIDMLSICIVNVHTVAALNSCTHTPRRRLPPRPCCRPCQPGVCSCHADIINYTCIVTLFVFVLTLWPSLC